jgi:hypothetical protein
MPAKKKTSNKSSRTTKQSKDQVAETDICFVIMPFGSWFDYYYETVYVSAIKSTGLVPRRADDLYRPSAIVHDIWTLTQQAKIILADLSGKNPNVFYELGLAHALTKPAILITESMDDVPFDLRSLRVIVYDKNEPNWGEVLKKKIETAINEILVSPLEAVLPTFLRVRETTSKITVSKEEKELISLRQDVDLLKRQAQTVSEPSQQVSKSRMAYGEGKAIAESGLMKNVSERTILEVLERYGFSSRTARSILDAARNELEEKKQKTGSLDIEEKST